jgi:putative addiction module CopG family antidote
MMASISPDLEAFVAGEVSSGRFPDRDAVISCALRLLQQDRSEAVLGIQAGLADVDAGRVQPLHDAFEELRREFNPSRSK